MQLEKCHHSHLKNTETSYHKVIKRCNVSSLLEFMKVIPFFDVIILQAIPKKQIWASLWKSFKLSNMVTVWMMLNLFDLLHSVIYCGSSLPQREIIFIFTQFFRQYGSLFKPLNSHLSFFWRCILEQNKRNNSSKEDSFFNWKYVKHSFA